MGGRVRSIWSKIKAFFCTPWWRKKPISEIPHDATLVDVLTKMLMDSGCTVNKESMERLALFFTTSGKKAIEEGMIGLEKAKEQLSEEEKKWKIQ